MTTEVRPEYIAGWIDPHDASTNFETLRDQLAWRHDTEARAEYFMAHTPTAYTYGSGVGARTYYSSEYHPIVLDIQNKLNLFGKTYNVCFLNRYDNQKHQLGWHSDDTIGMRHDHPIAVVSFGAEREIWWRNKGQTGVIPANQRQLLGHGSLFVMPAGFQLTHEHRIPKADHTVGSRISLTYRYYTPGPK
jgi:hypothetical protein